MSSLNDISIVPSTKPSRERWTFQQRHDIRTYAQEHPRCTQQEIIKWCSTQWPDKRLTQGTCSVILSETSFPLMSSQTYRVKRGTSLVFQAPTAKRTKVARYGPLDEALFEWQQLMQSRKIAVSGLLLQTKAAEFWNALPQYTDHDPPIFDDD